MKKIRVDRRNAGRKCIFCGAGNVSKEHFFSSWMHPLLPRKADSENVNGLFTRRGRDISQPPVIRTRQGPVFTKTIRCVCAKCNNGWMNTIESAARGSLTSLIISEKHILTVDAQRAVAKWIALKVMVAEHDRPSMAVTGSEERRAFMDRGEIPASMEIWLGRCGVDFWQCAYMRHSTTISNSPNFTPTVGRNNIHSVTFGIGDLFIFVLQNNSNVPLKLEPVIPGFTIKILPATAEHRWPPPETIPERLATGIAHTLEEPFSKAAGWLPRQVGE